VALYTNLLLNLPIDDTDVAMHVHPLSHAAGQLMFGYLAAGATQVIRRAFNFSAHAFFEDLRASSVTSVFIIPTVLTDPLISPARTCADTSTLVYGGAPMPVGGRRVRCG
jgi:acyl-CoA synthetase (AMP-forming)/AMP-acid ligase II